MWVAFALQKLLTFLQHICISLNVKFYELLTNDIVSFEQLGPEVFPNNFNNLNLNDKKLFQNIQILSYCLY